MTNRPDQPCTHYLARLRTIHRELGITEDYLNDLRLPLCVEPAQLVDIGPDVYQRPQQLTPAAHAAWTAMRRAAESDGVELLLVSAYRGVDYQRDLIRRKLDSGRTLGDILQVIAAPGFSEHHTGRAIDLTTPGCGVLVEEFEETSAFQWLERRAGGFGFTLSYPRDNPHGISYEPWHWCYGEGFQPDAG